MLNIEYTSFHETQIFTQLLGYYMSREATLGCQNSSCCCVHKRDVPNSARWMKAE